MSARRASLLGIAAALLCILVPLAVAPWFHGEFRAPKLLVLACIGIPAALAALDEAVRRALHSTHLLLIFLLPSFIAAAVHDGGSLASIATALTACASFLVPLHLGAACGGGLSALRTLARALGAGALLVLLAGILRRTTGALDWIPDRADVAFSATIGNSNEVAEYATPVLLLLLLLPRPRWPDFLLATAALALVVLSESRAGLLALALGLAAGSAVLCRGPQRKHAHLLLAGLGIVALALLTLPACASLRARALSTFDPEHPTNAVRLALWSGGARLAIESQPLGCGPGGFEASFPPFREAAEWQRAGAASAAESPHNEVLALAAEYGVGGLLWLFGITLLGVARWRRLGSEEAGARGALFGLAVAFLVFALVRSPAHHPTGLLALGLALGWMFAATRRAAPASKTPAWLAGGFLVAALAGTCADVVEDLRTGIARRELAAADHWFRHAEPARGVAATLASAEAVRSISAAPFTPAHAFRTAVVSAELGALAEALKNSGALPPELAGMEELTQKLLRHTLEAEPANVPARLLLSEVLAGGANSGGRADGVAAAEDVLREGLLRTPEAPGLRARLATLLLRSARPREALLTLRGESRAVPITDALALELGRLELLHGGGTAASLRPGAELGNGAHARLESARRADVDARSREALEWALQVLADTPFNDEALDLVVRHGYGAREEDATHLAHAATARAKFLLARRELTLGDSAAARRNLKLALARDPELAPALLLEARLLLADGSRAAALTLLTTLRELVNDDLALRRALAEDTRSSQHLDATALLAIFSAPRR